MALFSKRILAFLLAMLVLIMLSALLAFPTKCSRQNTFIDVRTGRMRTERYIFFMKVSDKFSDTDMSVIWKKIYGDYPEGDWRLVNTLNVFGIGVSPHYRYHGSLVWQKALVAAFGAARFDLDAERYAINTYFRFLADGDERGIAQRYAMHLLDYSTRNYGENIKLQEVIKISENEQVGGVTNLLEGVGVQGNVDRVGSNNPTGRK